MKLKRIKRISGFLVIFFIIATNMFAQKTTQTNINNTQEGESITISGQKWIVARKVNHSDGYKYAMLYSTYSFHYNRFGETKNYNNSDIRAAFTNRYATNKEYDSLRAIAVLVTPLSHGSGFDTNVKSELPSNPQLASATGTTTDVIFLPTVKDVKDWTFNVALTFGYSTTGQRLITRTPVSGTENNICGFIQDDNKTLIDNGGLSASVNSSGKYQFRPCIWVRVGSLEPTISIGSISAPPAELCSGESLTLAKPEIINNGTTITNQGWQIETSEKGFTDITLPYIVSNNDNGKKLRYYINYSNNTIYSNEVIISVNSSPVLTQPDNFTFCAEKFTSQISFTGTNVNSVAWQIISGTGTSIGMNANNGTGNIPSFVASAAYPTTVSIKVTPVSASGCEGDAKIFTITVNPMATAANLVTRDTTINLGNILNLNHLVSSSNVINPNFKWYKSPFDITPMSTAIVFPDMELQYYFVSVEGDNYCEGGIEARKIVTVNVNMTGDPIDIEEIEVCKGTTVTLTAIPTNGGSLPAYQWKKNGTNIDDATNSTYTYVPENGDIISCEMTSNADCAVPATAISVNAVIIKVFETRPLNLSEQNICPTIYGQRFRVIPDRGFGLDDYSIFAVNTREEILYNANTGIVTIPFSAAGNIKISGERSGCKLAEKEIEVKPFPPLSYSSRLDDCACELLQDKSEDYELILNQSGELIVGMKTPLNMGNISAGLHIQPEFSNAQCRGDLGISPYLNRIWSIEPDKQPNFDNNVELMLFFSKDELSQYIRHSNSSGIHSSLKMNDDLLNLSIMGKDEKSLAVTRYHNTPDTKDANPCESIDKAYLPATIIRLSDNLYAAYTNTNSFSNFVIHSNAFESPLPITLLWFKGYCENGNIVLNWRTASESNNDYFTIMASEDGYNYSPILKVDGAGNSNTIIDYHKTIDNPYSSNVIYLRLKQTDYDGIETTSYTIVLNTCDKISEIDIQIYPNPTNGELKMYNGELKIKNVEIYDITGKKILNSQFSNLNSIDVSHLQAGIYFVKIYTSKGEVIKRLVKN